MKMLTVKVETESGLEAEIGATVQFNGELTTSKPDCVDG